MTLDSFEATLLAELRSHVTKRNAPPKHSRRRRWAWASVPVVAAGAVATGLALAPTSSAYTVHKAGNGDIVVTIKRLDDAHGLERALRADGVTAEVNYGARPTNTADDEDCAPTGWSGPDPGAPVLNAEATIAADGSFTLHLPADAATGGRVLHLTTDGRVSGSRGVATLRVAWTC
jgi:hypothetical protein